MNKSIDEFDEIPEMPELTEDIPGEFVGRALEPCPCGAQPRILYICFTGQGRKWAQATGNCCEIWGVEFPTDGLEPQERLEAAITAWNTAPRATESLRRPPQPSEHAE